MAALAAHFHLFALIVSLAANIAAVRGALNGSYDDAVTFRVFARLTVCTHMLSLPAFARVLRRVDDFATGDLRALRVDLELRGALDLLVEGGRRVDLQLKGDVVFARSTERVDRQTLRVGRDEVPRLSMG